MKMTKTASYFRFRKITKSKEAIEITHCATSLVNGKYNSVGFIPRSQFYLCNYSIELDSLICINLCQNSHFSGFTRNFGKMKYFDLIF